MPADFDEVDFGVAETAHPDEVLGEGPAASVRFPNNATNSAQQRSSTAQNVNSRPPNGPMNAPLSNAAHSNTPASRGVQQQQVSSLNAAQKQPVPSSSRPLQPQLPQQPRPMPPQSHMPATTASPNRSGPLLTSNIPPPTSGPPSMTDPSVPPNAPVGFFTARAAEKIQAAPATLPDNVAFNPHAETPSIPRTPGFDHTCSKPVAATKDVPGTVRRPGNNQSQPQQQHQPSNQNSNQPNAAQNSGSRPNVVNPHLDNARRIGMPGAMGTSPLQNRSSYKVPSLKRPAEGAATMSNAAPLQA